MINVTKTSMIDILDILMNGDPEVLVTIMGKHYDTFLDFFDTFKSINKDIIFMNILCNIQDTLSITLVIKEDKYLSELSKEMADKAFINIVVA